MKLFEKILVPTDFSAHATVALRFAGELAKTCDAAIQLLHVYDLVPYALPEGMAMYDIATLARLHEDMTKQLSLAKGELLKSGVKQVEMTLVQGQPYPEIVRLAAEGGCQLIVMGTHGRSGLAHLLLGSVAERVVRKAPCPVVTVPSKEEAHAKS